MNWIGAIEMELIKIPFFLLPDNGTIPQSHSGHGDIIITITICEDWAIWSKAWRIRHISVCMAKHINSSFCHFKILQDIKRLFAFKKLRHLTMVSFTQLLQVPSGGQRNLCTQLSDKATLFCCQMVVLCLMLTIITNHLWSLSNNKQSMENLWYIPVCMVRWI